MSDTNTKNSTKSVRFVADNDERNTIHVFEALSTDQLWFGDDDLEASKHEMRAQTLKLRREGAHRLVENAFSNPASDAQKCLNEFSRHSEGRGLERHSSAKHFEERMLHRSVALKAILLGQREALERGLKVADVSEQLRELSLRYCCTAKIFARRMGKADEYACYKKSKAASNSCSNNSTSSPCKSHKKCSTKKSSSKTASLQRSPKRTRQSCSVTQMQTSTSSRSLAIMA